MENNIVSSVDSVQDVDSFLITPVISYEETTDFVVTSVYNPNDAIVASIDYNGKML